MNRSSSAATKFRHRRRARGATLVEAAVVAPVLAIFLVLSLYIWSCFRQNFLLKNTTRQKAFFEAAHDCQKIRVEGKELLTLPPNADDVAKSMPGSDGKGVRVATQSYFWASEEKSQGNVNIARYSADFKNASFVLCNDPPYDGHWLLWFYEGEKYFAGKNGFP